MRLERVAVKVGRWIARQETYDRMIAPALADMEFERSAGLLRQFVHWTHFPAIFLYAILWDLRLDLVSSVDGRDRRRAWTRAGLWYVGAAILMTVLPLWESTLGMLLLQGLWREAALSAGLNAVVDAAAVATVPAVIYLLRSGLGRRSLAVVVLLLSILAAGTAWAVRPIRASADQALVERVRDTTAPSAASRFADRMEASNLDQRSAWWHDLRSGLWVFSFGLWGVVLSSRSGWGIASALFRMLCTWYLIVAFLSRYRSFREATPIEQDWKEFAMTTSVALLWLAADGLIRLGRRAEIAR